MDMLPRADFFCARGGFWPACPSLEFPGAKFEKGPNQVVQVENFPCQGVQAAIFYVKLGGSRQAEMYTDDLSQ